MKPCYLCDNRSWIVLCEYKWCEHDELALVYISVSLSFILFCMIPGNLNMTGGIPTVLGSLSSLEYFDLGMCLCLSYMVWIDVIYSYDDSTTFTCIWCFLLCDMNTANNVLTGGLPSELGKLGALTGFSLAGNTLTGPIPSEIGNISGLVSLDLGE